MIRNVKPEDIPAITNIYNTYITNTCITFEHLHNFRNRTRQRKRNGTAHEKFHGQELSLLGLRKRRKSYRILLRPRLERKTGLQPHRRNNHLSASRLYGKGCGKPADERTNHHLPQRKTTYPDSLHHCTERSKRALARIFGLPAGFTLQ